MKTRKIGNLEVSEIGFGCMGLTHAYGNALPKNEAIRTLRAAFDVGYNFFDTAECYTGTDANGVPANNEEIVGEALRELRGNVVVATKFGVTHAGNSLLVDSRPETILRSVDGSLKRLGIEQIDLYYQHRIDPKIAPEIVAGTMSELIRAGKIRAWGISEANTEYLRRAHAICPVSAIQNRYSMLARWHENLFDVCEELNVGFVAFSPIANGFLSDAFAAGTQFEAGDFRNKMPQYSTSARTETSALLALLRELSARHNATPAQISLAWLLAKKPFIVPIPGTRKISRLCENAAAATLNLSTEEISQIDELLAHSHITQVFGGNAIRA